VIYLLFGRADATSSSDCMAVMESVPLGLWWLSTTIVAWVKSP